MFVAYTVKNGQFNKLISFHAYLVICQKEFSCTLISRINPKIYDIWTTDLSNTEASPKQTRKVDNPSPISAVHTK